MTLEQELRQQIMGNTLGVSKFFLPTDQFIRWMKKLAGSLIVYDVGAGAGHVTKLLLDAGVRVIGLDLFSHMKPVHPVLITDGTNFPYEEGSIVMLCRPCHGGFAYDVIRQAVDYRASKVIYVGLERNVEDDLQDYFDKVSRFSNFKKQRIIAGEEGERVWVMGQ